MSELIFGVFLGIFSTIILINLLWFIYNKEKAYLYYVCMQTSILIIIILDNYSNYPSVLAGISAIFFSFLFTKEFLNLSYYYKDMALTIVKIAFFISLFFLVIYVSDNLIIMKLFPYSSLFLIFSYLGFKVYKKGHDYAKYFIVAWSVFFIFVLIGDLNRIFDLNLVYIKYVGILGNILEITILTFALIAKTKNSFEEKKEQEELLTHRAKLSFMGEMISSIAHQWRQPLNRISSIQMTIYSSLEQENKNYISSKLKKIDEQVEYMSNTVDDFSNFFKKDKNKTSFKISNTINKVLKILDSSLHKHEVNLKIQIKDDFELYTYENELSQVLLNILQNAIDALVFNKIKKPKIKILCKNNTIFIKDNAKGIEEKILKEIFNPYFTTKKKNDGTGLGLYICKIIVENNLKATLSVKNSEKGASFIIKFETKKNYL